MPERSTVRVAVRNLGRNPRRTALALLAVAVAQLSFLAAEGVIDGYVDSVLAAITGPMLGDVQVHARRWREDHAIDRVLPGIDGTLEAIRRDADVERASARAYAPVLAALGERGHAALVVGIDPVAEGGPGGLLARLPPRVLAARSAVVGRALASRMGVRIGDEVALVGQAADGSIASGLYRVGGVLTTSAERLERMGIVLSLADSQELLAMPGAAHEIVVKARPGSDAGAVAARLAGLPALAGAEVLPWRRLVPELASLIDLASVSGAVVLILVLSAAAAGIANTLVMSTFERTHEIGMLLALGCTPGRLIRMILLEAAVLGMSGAALGSAAGAALVALTSRSGIDLAALSGVSLSEIEVAGLGMEMRIFPRLDPASVFAGVGAILATALLAAWWPAARAARLEPVEAMRT